MDFDRNAFRQIVVALGRCTVRRYLSSKAGLLGALLLLLAGLPASLRASTLAAGPRQLALLTGLFAFLALLPLVTASAFADGRAAERLRQYPVSAATRAAGLAASSLFELPLLLAFPPILALLLSGGWVPWFVMPSFTLATLTLGQALLLAAGALAERRRVRESAAFLLPFAVAAALVVGIASPSQAAALVRATGGTVSAGLAALPPGLAHAALHQSPLVALAAGLGLALWSVVGVAVSVRLTERGREPAERGGTQTIGRRGPGLPGALGAMVGKDLRQLQREPFLRGGLTQGSVAVAAVVVVTLQPPNVGVQLVPTLGTGAFAYLLLWCLQLVCNHWGPDSAAGRLLWSFPGERWRWIVAKNLVYGPVIGCVAAGVVGLLAATAHARIADTLRFVGSAGASTLVAVAVGNIVSAVAPFGLIAPPGRSEGRMAGQSFGVSMLYLALGGASVAVGVQGYGGWLGSALYVGSVPVAASLLRRRERAVADSLVG